MHNSINILKILLDDYPTITLRSPNKLDSYLTSLVHIWEI